VLCESRQILYNPRDPRQQQLQTIPDHDQISIIPDKARRRPQMYNRCSYRTLLCENVHMSHNIMSGQLLFGGGILKIDIVDVVLHLSNFLHHCKNNEPYYLISDTVISLPHFDRDRCRFRELVGEAVLILLIEKG
jgi:hypothetical protein